MEHDHFVYNTYFRKAQEAVILKIRIQNQTCVHVQLNSEFHSTTTSKYMLKYFEEWNGTQV